MECRKKAGLTQEQLAEILCTKKATISAYENDRIDIKISILKDIARALGTSVAYLADGASEENNGAEILMLYNSINNEIIKKAAIEQIRILTNL